MQQLAVVILAAGKGRRMGNPDLPKVMAELAGKPLIGHVVEQALHLHPDRLIIIVGHKGEMVSDYLRLKNPNIEFATQSEQLGTGHAVLQTREALNSFSGIVLILSGDVPMLRASTLSDFIADHVASSSVLSVLSCIAADPTGYGRILRNEDGEFESIVEQKDASDEEREVAEINSGVYVVNSELLFQALDAVTNTNAQGEFYLTDIVSILHARNEKISAFAAPDYQELMGINTVAELAEAERVLALGLDDRTPQEKATA